VLGSNFEMGSVLNYLHTIGLNIISILDMVRLDYDLIGLNERL
jgi:hypothetical protein